GPPLQYNGGLQPGVRSFRRADGSAGDYDQSSPHPRKECSPDPPPQEHHGLRTVMAKKQAVVFAEPLLQRDEPSTGSARFHLGNERPLIRAECVDVDIMATS